jgi:hypothetical protein
MGIRLNKVRKGTKGKENEKEENARGGEVHGENENENEKDGVRNRKHPVFVLICAVHLYVGVGGSTVSKAKNRTENEG